MARPLRIEFKGAIYHVTARGNERRNIYFDKTDYNKFLAYLAETKKKFGILIHCYVLMSNHFHLLIETPKANLSKAMHYINTSYTTYINKKRNRSGHLFQGRYKAIVVDKDSYLSEVSRYLHLNPVRAGNVHLPEEYLFSSYTSYIKNRKDELLTKDLILGIMHDNRRTAIKKYREFVESAIELKSDNVFEYVYGGIILGGRNFIEDTLQMIEDERLQKSEVSKRKELQSTHDIEDILDIVANHFKVKREDIVKGKRRELRKITIYLIKRYTSATNGRIGDVFGGITHSAVSRLYERFVTTMDKNSVVKKEIAKIESKM
jgi:REP element-mobilizing transposase RayT